MAAGKAVGDTPARPAGWSRTLGLLNPLRAVWWLFTNVRFAILLLLIISVVSILGVVIPQVPDNIRGNAAMEQVWLQSQESRYGFLTNPMDRLALFDIFQARWFAILLAVTVVSTGAYVVSRFPGAWRSITKPRKRVPDRYFQMAPHRVHSESPIDPGRLSEALRRRRYGVEPFQEGEATYLFADRFQWAQLGTLLTHIAVIVFILAAVVSRIDTFATSLFLGEGSTLPIFAVSHPEQMQVELVNMHAEFARDGQPLDYRSDLVIYQGGEEVMRCESTVNSPCSYEGYRFYQAAYFGFGAGVQVRDLGTGNVVYRETLALVDRSPAPHVVITGARGDTIFDDVLVLSGAVAVDDFAFPFALVPLDGDRFVTIGMQDGDAALRVLEPGGDIRLSLAAGETAAAGGYEFAFVAESTTPSVIINDFPLPATAHDGPRGEALLQMSNVVWGVETASDGGRVETPSTDGPPRLTMVGLQHQAVTLDEGEAVEIGGYEYTFLGQREFSGIQVRRDRSDYLIWVGATMIVAGLMITFWVPRRRLWAKITATGVHLAGQAASHADYTRELRALAREAGADIPEGLEDDD